MRQKRAQKIKADIKAKVEPEQQQESLEEQTLTADQAQSDVQFDLTQPVDFFKMQDLFVKQKQRDQFVIKNEEYYHNLL